MQDPARAAEREFAVPATAKDSRVAQVDQQWIGAVLDRLPETLRIPCG